MGEYLHSAPPDSRINKFVHKGVDVVPKVTPDEQRSTSVLVAEYALRQEIEPAETRRVLSILGLV